MAPATTVRAKFLCTDIMTPTTASGVTVTLMAVTAGDANTSWATATPAGFVQLGLMTEAAASLFEQGKEYFLDFTRADLPGLLPLAPSDAGLTSANDRVLALVPDADPAHVEAAIQAFDKVASDGATHEEQKGAAVMAAIGAGADDVRAHAIAAAIPVLTLGRPASTDPAPLDSITIDPSSPFVADAIATLTPAADPAPQPDAAPGD